MPIRLAIMNDYEVVVLGLASQLRRYEDVVNIVELNANTELETPADVVLYDTFAQTQADQAELSRLRADRDMGKLVVYSWNTRTPLVRSALDRGAHGYLSKTLPAAQLVSAIQQIHAGQTVVATGDDDRVVGGDWPGREEGLTAREAEVLALITQGLSNKQVAERTGVSINSVKSYIRTAYRRIGVTTRPMAILWGIEHGFQPDRMRITEPDLSTLP